MRILALDTTGEFGSIALRENASTIVETHLHSADGFAHVVFPAIDRLLREVKWRIGEIDCFAAASGPGSFTGVRVGLAAVKGLAEAAGKLVAAVSNLRALAAFGTSDRRAVILDARRGEIYGAVYDAGLNPVIPDSVMKFPAWLEKLSGAEHEFIAFANAPFREALEAAGLSEMKWTEAPRSIASAIAVCAELDAHSGRLVSALAADANYVRRSDAELFWKEG
jgi:tRNA threonylcarbamoyladenosine biosynthesis protein TsaB